MPNRPLKVNFVLPGFAKVPIGGYKVVYQYANALSRRGHTVRVIHPPWCNIKEPVSASNYLRQQIKILAGPFAARQISGKRISWFTLDDNVEQVTVPDLRERYIPDADATVASAWTTAPWVASYGRNKGRGYYLIQHYEAWEGLGEAVNKTWTLPLHKIVIAKWLAAKAEEFGESASTTYIPNGLDFQQFHLTNPIEERRQRILMLGHKAAWKGMEDGIEALRLASAQFPELACTVFGTDRRPNKLPDWIEYKQLPSPDELTLLMNESSIFLHPSWSEGLPAPPAESMACGCALVAAANEGVLDYVTNNLTAMIAPTKSPTELGAKLIQLLNDDSLRVQIAKAGHEHIGKYTWERAEDLLEKLLLEQVKSSR